MNNTFKSLPTIALIAFTTGVMTMLIQACGGTAVAQTADTRDPIEGVWESSVALQDCTSGAVVQTIKVATLLYHGGSLNSEDSNPPGSRSNGFGTWTHGSGTDYILNLSIMRFDDDGSLAGWLKAQRSVKLSNTNAISGTLKAQVLAVDGTVLQEICGTETGGRTY